MPTHVPEAAYRRRPANEPTARQAVGRDASPKSGDRPTRLLDPAEPAQVTFLQPEGPLATLRWRGTSRPIVTTVGPERIGRRWWHSHLSQRAFDVRDYYKLQCADGLWLWIYRTRSFARKPARWFVHGVWS
jgi:protein ImuB